MLSRLIRRRRRREIQVPREVAERASDHLLEMDEQLELLAAMPGLEAFPETQRVPEEFLPTLARALSAYDRYVQTIVDGAGLQVSCASGCSACCHDVPTGVQAVELLAIYATYREFADFEALHNRACDLADELYELLVERAGEARSVQSDSPIYQEAQLAFRRRRRRCIFLGDDDRCRIYARRPLPCRMHFSISHPDQCWVDHDAAEDAVTPNFEPPDDMLVHMRRAAKRMGLSQLSPSLFQGLAVLGGSVMKTRPLRTSGPRDHR